MKAKPHPEQGFRSCLGIMRLVKTYGAARVEARSHFSAARSRKFLWTRAI
jgi:hypothetical protein